MGKRQEKIKTTVRVDRHLWGLLRARATEENVSLSTTLERILREYFEEE